MKREEAIKFWEFRYENAKDYTDPHWEAQERREHREYVEALRVAIEALQGDMYCPNCGVRLVQENEYLEPTQTHGRLIDADALKGLLEKRKQFFVDAYGGSFHCMSEKDKSRCDEIDACIASIVNAPTVTVVDITQRDLCEDINCEDCPFLKGTCKLMDCVAYADRPHGEWIDKQAYNQEIDTYVSWIECSVCGCAPYYGLDSQYNFCPNCGADMRKEKE